MPMESVRGPRNVALAPGVGAGTWIVTPMPNDFFAYLNGWSRHPKAVGGPFPSSPWTARRLAQAALDMAIPKGGPVLELGAGTGPVTEALIEAGRSVAEIIAVEQGAALCQTLEPGPSSTRNSAVASGEMFRRWASGAIAWRGQPPGTTSTYSVEPLFGRCAKVLMSILAFTPKSIRYDRTDRARARATLRSSS